MIRPGSFGSVASRLVRTSLAIGVCLCTAQPIAAEIEYISGASRAWICNDGERTAKLAKKLFRMPICVVSPSDPEDPPCPPGMERISAILWGDNEPVEREIEIRIYLRGARGELLERKTVFARKEESRLVAWLSAPARGEAGNRLEATFVLPRRIRRLEPGECLSLIVNPSRWVEPVQ